jgi:DNA polymerase-3 subunit epsilon/exodeoxyribonuclease X
VSRSVGGSATGRRGSPAPGSEAVVLTFHDLPDGVTLGSAPWNDPPTSYVWTHGLGEQKRYAVQHTLRHQIWELDQPHHLHAHGRSLLGHTPDPDQTDAFATVRHHFERTAPDARDWLPMTAPAWLEADLVAVDLEGSGAQDRDHEAILEVAAVPLRDGQPDVLHALATLVNPGRSIPRRPWISPGINDQTLSDAPPLQRIATELTTMINGRWIVGHNVGVDWRLLHRHLPALEPTGLIDTLALARATGIDGGRSLTALIHSTGLDQPMRLAVPGSQPHRALWDATATAYLLAALVDRHWSGRPATLDNLRAVAGISTAKPAHGDQPSLF